MGWEGREGYENDTSREFDREGEVWWAVGSFGFRGMFELGEWRDWAEKRRPVSILQFLSYNKDIQLSIHENQKEKLTEGHQLRPNSNWKNNQIQNLRILIPGSSAEPGK